MTDRLIAFLRARLDEDEAAAGRASVGRWSVRQLGRHDMATLTVDGAHLADFNRHGAATSSAAHAARWDPSRVLADIAAKRVLLDVHADCGTGIGLCDDGGHASPLPSGCSVTDYFRALYQDHPDFDPSWRLETTP